MSIPSGPRPAEAVLANRRGITLMVLAMSAFIVNDALVKVVSESLPAGQLIVVRGLMASAIVLLILRLSAGPMRLRALGNRWVLARAAADAAATVSYLVSLFHLPIANATAINMATPLMITLMAALVLGERVGARRWLLIGAGFAGVLLVVQPGPEGFNVWGWLCVGSTVLNALRDLITRRLPADAPSGTVALASALAVTSLAAVLVLVQVMGLADPSTTSGGWVPVTAANLGLLAVAAVFLAAAYRLTVAATRTGELSVVAPFRYSALLLAVLLGWLVWGDVPNATAWAGIALIIAAGMALLRAAMGPGPARSARG
jgi:drug/metabolite transporter (DMT)-like permease